MIKGGHLTKLESRMFRKRRWVNRGYENKLMRLYDVAGKRGRESCGSMNFIAGCGDISIFEAQTSGNLVEMRLVRDGYIVAFLRGAAARRWDDEWPAGFDRLRAVPPLQS